MDVGTRKRKYPHPCSLELTPDLIIRKILHHSGDPSSPRLLKYLGHAKRTFSSSNLKLWSDLRTKGVLDKMETIIRSGGGGEEETRYQVFSICLSLLGNAYSLDYSARTEVRRAFIRLLNSLEGYLMCLIVIFRWRQMDL